MNKKTTVFGMLLLSISVFGFAQIQSDSTKVVPLDEVVITDSKFNLKRENSGKVITKITQMELQHLQGQTIASIIDQTVGIDINGTNSNAGQNLSYFIRGGRNRQVLILIDGIAVSDASQIVNDYDLRTLYADQVESIEILKGASSTLYGSGAATAVINISLKKASNDVISANFRSVLGTNQSQKDSNYAIENFNNSVALNGTLKDFNYLVSFGNQYADGLSAIANQSEVDVFNSIHGNLKLGYDFSDVFKMNVYWSFDKFKADFDDGFTFSDADNRSLTKQYRVGIAPEFRYKNGSINLNAAYNSIDREIISSFPAEFRANSYVADLFNRYNFNDTFYAVLGVNFQDNEMTSYTIPFGSTNLTQDINPDTANFSAIDPYVNVVYVSDFGMQLNAGARYNNHSEYGSQIVYSVNPSFKKDFNFGYIKGLASYSTAYITPSLYQLFEGTYGNLDLEPEENRTIEAGVEVQLNKGSIFSIVYFNRNEKNFIDFVNLGNFVFQYNNIDEEFTADGFEFTSTIKISDPLNLQLNGTYTKVEDDLNLRIPELKGNAKLNYKICESTFASVSYQFNDDRQDSFFNSSTFESETVTLKSYSLLDVYLSHRLLENKLTIFANFSNLLNEDYQELYGYSTKGRNINLGFNLKL